VRILVDLGNPGAKYERTRHNIGFRIATEAARKLGVTLGETRWSAVLGLGQGQAAKTAVLLPQTFMNLSGEPTGHAARFWKVAPPEIVVAHDDMDLEFGRIQVKQGGGDGGHNGLRSLKAHLGTADFVRVRFGVGRPPPQWEGADWVLGKFSQDEEAVLRDLVPQAAEAAVAAVLEGAIPAMNKHNRRKTEAKQ